MGRNLELKKTTHCEEVRCKQTGMDVYAYKGLSSVGTSPGPVPSVQIWNICRVKCC